MSIVTLENMKNSDRLVGIITRTDEVQVVKAVTKLLDAETG